MQAYSNWSYFLTVSGLCCAIVVPVRRSAPLPVLQALPHAWPAAALPRSLNTATSTISDASGASLAKIEPPNEARLANTEDRSVQQDGSSFRSHWAHILRRVSTSRERTEDSLQTMAKYLYRAKAEVDRDGRTSVLLDQHVIMNYITCEDMLLGCDIIQMTRAAMFLYQHSTVSVLRCP